LRWVVKATHRPLSPRERHGIPCIGGWIVQRAVCMCAENLAIRDSIPGHSIP
jgi:hypothetical protein